MKKRICLLLIFVIAVICFATACSDDGSNNEPPEVTLSSIEITVRPRIIAYMVGQTFDPDGMVVIAKYSDNSFEEISDYTYPTTPLSSTDTRITISFTKDGITKITEVNITVTAVDAVKPAIASQPQDAVSYGEKTTFTVDASLADEGTLSYQWFFNTVNSTGGATEISGATTSSYQVTVTETGTFYYFVKITNINNDASGLKTATVTSKIAKLQVPLLPTEGLSYTLLDDESSYGVSGIGSATDTVIVIPLTYNDLPVTQINSNAFKNNQNITEVRTLSNIKSIESSAFERCANLKKVQLADGLLSIGSLAFSRCDLSSIILPNSLTKIGSYAFEENRKIISIIIPSNVTEIDIYAFYCCFYLTIYAEAETEPIGWVDEWNVRTGEVYRPVIWGCTLSQDKTYVESFTMTSESITNPTASKGTSAPVRAGYSFGGWATSVGSTTKAYSSAKVVDAPDGTTLYAIWKSGEAGKSGSEIGTYSGSAYSSWDDDTYTGSIQLKSNNQFTIKYNEYSETYYGTYEIYENSIYLTAPGWGYNVEGRYMGDSMSIIHNMYEWLVTRN